MDLAQVFTELKVYQKAMGYDADYMTEAEQMEAVRNYVLALQVEQSEFLNELPWKPWKSYRFLPIIRERVIEEWVDCFVFLIDQAICLSITPDEVDVSYKHVVEKLFNRIKSGYSKVKEASIPATDKSHLINITD